MLRIAICDDEKLFLKQEKELIAKILDESNNEYEIDKYTSGKALLKNKEKIAKYDIVFLDVDMNEIDGLETAKRIRIFNESIFIVFVSAYYSYSLEGYKVNAVRYIIKENENLELSYRECIISILEIMNATHNTITFNFQEGDIELDVSKIMFIESNLHKLIFHMNGSSKMDYTMYEKLDNIQIDGFCRIHKSYLINMKYVVDMSRYNVVLADEIKLRVAKTRYPEVKQQIMTFRGKL